MRPIPSLTLRTANEHNAEAIKQRVARLAELRELEARGEVVNIRGWVCQRVFMWEGGHRYPWGQMLPGDALAVTGGPKMRAKLSSVSSRWSARNGGRLYTFLHQFEEDPAVYAVVMRVDGAERWPLEAVKGFEIPDPLPAPKRRPRKIKPERIQAIGELPKPRNGLEQMQRYQATVAAMNRIVEEAGADLVIPETDDPDQMHF